MLQVNLNAPFFLTQACLPLLSRSADAAVLFTSDSVGRHGKAYWGAYGVAKAGVENLMQILAEELENTAIRVNSIDPGPTRTALRKRVFPGENPQTVKPPEDLMPMYLWLMGPDSAATRGAALAVE